MATRTLQPSEYDIQREVEALRDIRRRSITPGALTIDPDLPGQSSSTSPTYRLSPSNLSPTASPSSPTDNSSAEGSSSGETANTTDTTPTGLTVDDPFHLFWVPASLHPEIAPAEFRAFLKEHARSPPPSDDEFGSSKRSSSLSVSSSLARKRSMLSRQYRPTENDGVEDEQVVPLIRNRSGYHTNRGPQLTINDLQKLEELAEQASQTDDPSKLRSVLRRSLSLNVSPSVLEKMDQVPDIGDEADVPIIVPPPGQILRRAARTKIRKPSLPGDGGGHRFDSPRRRGPKRSLTTAPEPRTSSDRSSSDHGESIESSFVSQRRGAFSDEGHQQPDSFTEEVQIYDSYIYVRDDEEDGLPPAVITSPLSPAGELPDIQTSPPSPERPTELPPTDLPPSLFEALGPVIYHPEPQNLAISEPSSEQPTPSRTPSPPSNELAEPQPPATGLPLLPQVHPPFLSTSPPQPQRKEKDKKGLFGKWGSGDKTSKKGAKDKDRENKERNAEKEKEKEKDSGFFGSLFGGGSKKKQDEAPPLVPSGTTGREAAQALLGAPKPKGFVSPVSPLLSAGIGPNNYARYPIHVERAIYRLSHIKLANPRRPLYEQVLISNLMFWYLGVINKAQATPAAANGQAPGAQPAATTGNAEQGDEENAEKERREQEQGERERVEKERLEKEQREAEVKRRESGKRGSLTKASAHGTPGGGRRAEIPVKGPQYEMQHRVMEQEYGGYNSPGGTQMGRSLSAPGGSNQGARSIQQPQPLQMPGQSQSNDYVYYSTDQNQQRAQSGADQHAWQQSQMRSPTSPTSGSKHLPPQQARSPPQKDNPLPSNAGRYNNTNTSQENLVLSGGSERTGTPSRSLSASAVASSSPQINGRSRKGQSAQATAPSPGRRSRNSGGQQDMNGSAEEDIPLAMWQQQRRR